MTLPRSGWRVAAKWASSLLVLSALVGAALHLGEIERFVALARALRPEWLLLAGFAQLGTYACTAIAWYLTLRMAGQRISAVSLIPLSVAKLFADQAIPTAGVSGAMLMVRGFQRRHVRAPEAIATMLVALVSYYAAYRLVVFASLLLLWLHHQARPSIEIAFALFAVVAIGIPVLVLGMRGWSWKLADKLLRRMPILSPLIEATRNAPTGLLRDPRVIAGATALEVGVFLLDALTLWIVFEALGQRTEFWILLASFVTASVAATIGPVPLGLGTFEAAAVTMLVVLGIPIETALAATLLLRGMTFWLPMVPGLWLARREIRGGHDAMPRA